MPTEFQRELARGYAVLSPSGEPWGWKGVPDISPDRAELDGEVAKLNTKLASLGKPEKAHRVVPVAVVLLEDSNADAE